MSKKTIACLTPDRLRELAQEPNNVVYTQVHDIQYTAWSGDKVKACVNKLVALTRSGLGPDTIKSSDPELADFAGKYTVFFSKLTDPLFVADASHVRTVLELVQLKTMVDNGEIDATEAQGRSASLALTNLQMRVASEARPNARSQQRKNETTVEELEPSEKAMK